jgi:hypothetical protein
VVEIFLCPNLIYDLLINFSSDHEDVITNRKEDDVNI